jgi:hypothetical protein
MGTLAAQGFIDFLTPAWSTMCHAPARHLLNVTTAGAIMQFGLGKSCCDVVHAPRVLLKSCIEAEVVKLRGRAFDAYILSPCVLDCYLSDLESLRAPRC